MLVGGGVGGAWNCGGDAGGCCAAGVARGCGPVGVAPAIKAMAVMQVEMWGDGSCGGEGCSLSAASKSRTGSAEMMTASAVNVASAALAMEVSCGEGRG
jgi:hypothetical protein